MSQIEEFGTFKVFEGFKPEEIEKVIEISVEEVYTDEEILMEDSIKDVDLFLLTGGSAQVEIDAPHIGSAEKRILLTVLRTGDIFGEIAFLEGHHRSAYVKAINQVKVLRFNHERMFEMLNKNSNIGYRFMKNIAVILARRLVDTNFRWRNDLVGLP